MNTKHTPGPWTYSLMPGNHNCHIAGIENIPVIDTDHFEVIEADARLIAAAPEMFEVLELLWSDLKKHNLLSQLDIEVFISFEDAIKKAKGEK